MQNLQWWMTDIDHVKLKGTAHCENASHVLLGPHLFLRNATTGKWAEEHANTKLPVTEGQADIRIFRDP